MAKSKQGHPYKSTHITHHTDGSHTMHHEHATDSSKDKHHAVADLDAVHDKMEENLGTPNTGEAEAPAGEQAAPGTPGAAPEPGM
jgi:hypothetical protein